MKEKLIEFIGKAQYDQFGQIIWGNVRGGLQMLCDVRGWGAIQHLFKSQEEAGKFQDYMGQFTADAINEKIERLK